MDAVPRLGHHPCLQPSTPGAASDRLAVKARRFGRCRLLVRRPASFRCAAASPGSIRMAVVTIAYCCRCRSAATLARALEVAMNPLATDDVFAALSDRLRS